VVVLQGVDFKRLWKVHRCVAIIDLADEQCDSMKLMFQEAVKSSAFLRSFEVCDLSSWMGEGQKLGDGWRTDEAT